MNARQRKKKIKKWVKRISEEVDDHLYCQYCFKQLDLKRNKYALRYGTCNQKCYKKMVD